MRALILALGLVAAPAADAERFDYVCTTEVRYRADGAWQPSTARYRIDLAARRWCEGDCSVNSPIVATNENWLFLEQNFREGEFDDYARERIHRRTGELTMIRIGAGPLGPYLERRGQCERAAFTAFPAESRALTR